MRAEMEDVWRKPILRALAHLHNFPPTCIEAQPSRLGPNGCHLAVEMLVYSVIVENFLEPPFGIVSRRKVFWSSNSGAAIYETCRSDKTELDVA